MWKNVPDSQHTIFFNEFKKFYTWIESDAWIRETFLKHCARQYSRWLSRIKNAKAKRGKPKVISDAGWKLFEEYWELETTKRKAATMAGNRKSGESKHCGGSRSNCCHKKTLTKELGREPNVFEVMKKTYLKKDGSGYVDEKSRKIDEEVTARVNALKQIASSGDGESAGDGEVQQGEGEVDVDLI